MKLGKAVKETVRLTTEIPDWIIASNGLMRHCAYVSTLQMLKLWLGKPPNGGMNSRSPDCLKCHNNMKDSLTYGLSRFKTATILEWPKADPKTW
jgi:hypothetical protein